MPLYCVSSESHHSQERPEFRDIVEAAPEEIELKALEAVFEFDSWGRLGEIADFSPLKEALAKAKQQGEAAFEVEYDYAGTHRFALWYLPAGTRGNLGCNFGFGAIPADADTTAKKPSEFTDKYENRWIGFYAWERDEQRYQELLRMEKDELADRICRLEAR